MGLCKGERGGQVEQGEVVKVECQCGISTEV